jgi:hypothetical protein
VFQKLEPEKLGNRCLCKNYILPKDVKCKSIESSHDSIGPKSGFKAFVLRVAAYGSEISIP